jgi:glutamate-1-semialdehyde 2,1-aminomutase
LRTALPDAQITRVGTLTGLFFSPEPVQNYEQAQQADHARYAQLFHHLLRKGVFFAPSGYETLFVSLAHDDDHIDATVASVEEFARQ